MARDEAPPFGRGQTWYGGGTIDVNDLGGQELEGREYEFEDLDYSVQGGAPQRTGRRVRVRIVRNMSGIALLPKRLASLQGSAGVFGARVDGYATVPGQLALPIDEFLPSGGVPHGDLFYVVVKGPALCVVHPDPAAVVADIAVGDRVVAATGAASTAGTDPGNVRAPLAATTGATMLSQAINFVGYALTARASTTGAGSNILVEVGRYL